MEVVLHNGKYFCCNNRTLFSMKNLYDDSRSVMVNKNCAMTEHADKNNCGLSWVVAFGSYEDGVLYTGT
jgi:hypothetical protein